MQSAISESLNLYLRQFYLNINFYDIYIYLIHMWDSILEHPPQESVPSL